MDAWLSSYATDEMEGGSDGFLDQWHANDGESVQSKLAALAAALNTAFKTPPSSSSSSDAIRVLAGEHSFDLFDAVFLSTLETNDDHDGDHDHDRVRVGDSTLVNLALNVAGCVARTVSAKELLLVCKEKSSMGGDGRLAPHSALVLLFLLQRACTAPGANAATVAAALAVATSAMERLSDAHVVEGDLPLEGAMALVKGLVRGVASWVVRPNPALPGSYTIEQEVGEVGNGNCNCTPSACAAVAGPTRQNAVCFLLTSLGVFVDADEHLARDHYCASVGGVLTAALGVDVPVDLLTFVQEWRDAQVVLVLEMMGRPETGPHGTRDNQQPQGAMGRTSSTLDPTLGEGPDACLSLDAVEAVTVGDGDARAVACVAWERMLNPPVEPGSKAEVVGGMATGTQRSQLLGAAVLIQHWVHLLPLLFMPAHQWDTMLPVLLILLQHARLGPVEGLALLPKVVTSVLGPDAAATRVPAVLALALRYLPMQPHAQQWCRVSCVGDLIRGTDDLRRLGTALASGTNTWGLMQLIGSAVVASQDGDARGSGYAALRRLLLAMHERERVILLRRLVRECPFPQLAALFVDILKDSVQMSWQAFIARDVPLADPDFYASDVEAVLQSPEPLPCLHVLLEWFAWPALEALATSESTDDSPAALDVAEASTNLCLALVLMVAARPAVVGTGLVDTATALKEATPLFGRCRVALEKHTAMRSQLLDMSLAAIVEHTDAWSSSVLTGMDTEMEMDVGEDSDLNFSVDSKAETEADVNPLNLSAAAEDVAVSAELPPPPPC